MTGTGEDDLVAGALSVGACVGLHVVEAALAAGHQVDVFSRGSAPTPPGTRHVHGDRGPGRGRRSGTAAGVAHTLGGDAAGPATWRRE